MAKRARKKKKNFIPILKWSIIGIVAVFLVVLVCHKTVYGLRKAEIFKVTEVAKAPSLQFISSRYLERLYGLSIFAVDIKGTQRRLQAKYPEVDQLRVVRQFPNRIYLSAKKREPFASLALSSQDILLDQEGVVLGINAPGSSRLPSIQGAPVTQRVVLGKSWRSSQVRTALSILREVQANEHLSTYRVSSIDVGNLSKINFHLSNNLHIIMDQEKTPKKIKSLGVLLSQGNLNLSEINYIDLRFKEPILGKK